MATPPPVSYSDVAAAMARIARRHRRAGADDPLLFSDDPWEVLSYLRKLRFKDLLEDETGHDVTDALTIKVGLWWEIERAELHFLNAAEAIGMRRRRVGQVLNVGTTQGMIDRTDRKRMLFSAAGKPDEKLARAERRTAPPPPEPVQHGELLWNFVQQLHANRDSLPEDIAEDVDYLIDELHPESMTLPAHVAGLVRDMRAAGVLQDDHWRGQVDLLLRWFAI